MYRDFDAMQNTYMQERMKNSELSETIAGLERQLEALTTLNESLENDLEFEKQNVSRLEDENYYLESDLTDLHCQIDDMSSEISALEAQLDG